VTVDRETLLDRVRNAERANGELALEYGHLSDELARVTAERDALAAHINRDHHEYTSCEVPCSNPLGPYWHGTSHEEHCRQCGWGPDGSGPHDTAAVVLARVAEGGTG